MLEKAIEQITAADLQELVDEKHREGKLVDFKADFWRVDKTTNPNQVDRDKQVVEFLKDVSSFANTDGGHLIVGITDEDGSAFDVCGVQPRSQDEWKSRLDQLMQKWLDPRINSVMRFIELAGGKQALVIHILPSTIAPHRVTYQEQGHFYARNSHGAYTMDTEELRASFNRSLAIADRIRNFHLQRIHLIETTGVPCQLRDEPRIVMHLIPQSSFTERVEFTIDEFKQLERQMGPPGERNWTGRPNLDGYVNISGSEDPHPKRGFLQLFRNGVLEAAICTITSQKSKTDKRFWARSVETSLLEALPNYLKGLDPLGITTPVWLFLTICRASQIHFHDEWSGDRKAFDRESLTLSEQMIGSLDDDANEILRPVLDQMWNAMGFEKCIRITDDGAWQQLTCDMY